MAEALSSASVGSSGEVDEEASLSHASQLPQSTSGSHDATRPQPPPPEWTTRQRNPSTQQDVVRASAQARDTNRPTHHRNNRPAAPTAGQAAQPQGLPLPPNVFGGGFAQLSQVPTRLYLTQPVLVQHQVSIPPTFGHFVQPVQLCVDVRPVPCSELFGMRTRRRTVVAEFPTHYRAPQQALVLLIPHHVLGTPHFRNDCTALTQAFYSLGRQYLLRTPVTHPQHISNLSAPGGLERELQALNEQRMNSLLSYDAVFIFMFAEGNRQYMQLENASLNVISKWNLTNHYARLLLNLSNSDTPVVFINQTYPGAHEYASDFLTGEISQRNVLGVNTFGYAAMPVMAGCLQRSRGDPRATFNRVCEELAQLNSEEPGTVFIYDVDFKGLPLHRMP